METKVSDIMIPLSEYPVIKQDQELKDAVSALQQIYCQVQEGKCTEAGHRNVLVQDEQGNLVGVLNFNAILRILVPEVAGGLSETLRAMNVFLAYAEAEEIAPGSEHGDFATRIKNNARVKTRNVMIKFKGFVQADSSMLDALKEIYNNDLSVLPVYEGSRPVGVLRDSDLFLQVASVLKK